MFWTKKISQQEVLEALRQVIDPAQQKDIVSLHWVSGIVIQKGHVLVTLDVDPSRQRELEPLRKHAEDILVKTKSITSAQVILTAEKKPVPVQPQPEQRAIAPHVKAIIAVASGKGGVGKSTVAANLAVALGLQGLNIGLLDADIYGPSVPMLLGVRQSKPSSTEEYLQPVEAHGIKVMSMGFMVDEEAPMVWRGPMVQSALLQMLRDVRWGTAENPLDILIIDMPPGTGDTQLTIAQKVKLSGAVIVSTPQDVALLDTVKGVNMFQKVSVPILGVIENMSVFTCPHCHTDTPIFGAHGARERAGQLGVPFLGEVPLALDIRTASDAGKPIVLNNAQPSASIFKKIAQQIINRIQNNDMQRPAPRIIIEEAS